METKDKNETSSLRSKRRHAACRLLDTAHQLRRASRALQTLTPSKESTLVTLLRVRDRIEGIAALLHDTSEHVKILGVSRKAPIIEINGERLGLRDVSRSLGEVRVALDNEIRTLSGGGHGQGVGGSGQHQEGKTWTEQAEENASAIAGWVALGAWIASWFNETDDDIARETIGRASADDIRRMNDNEVVDMMNAMLDGPTGDDDEEAILKLLEAFDCERRSLIVNRVGLDRLLSDVDGAEWDRLVNLLTDCGIIGIDQMDDDASRQFVNNRSCSQLSQLNMSAVRQLVLNMFSGSCGDDDEDAILKLLRCQSGPRLHQLVAMPGTDVGRFDYNFDGDQWDDLEALFAAHGIVLDA